MNKKRLKEMEDKKMIVVRVSKTEFELDNGDVYPQCFDIDEDITVDEFQKMLDDSKTTVLSHIKGLIDG